jgi:hypothetical protein
MKALLKSIMKKLNIAILICLLILGLLFSCRKVKCDGSDPSYTADTKSIIDSNCNSSGCHGSGSSNGVFTSYLGLKPYLDNGSFKREVLETRNMPQGSGKLSKAQLQKLQCWSENGYKEN